MLRVGNVIDSSGGDSPFWLFQLQNIAIINHILLRLSGFESRQNWLTLLIILSEPKSKIITCNDNIKQIPSDPIPIIVLPGHSLT